MPQLQTKNSSNVLWQKIFITFFVISGLIGGYWLYHNLMELKQEMEALRKVAEKMAETSESARRQAIRAEENSLLAALGRAHAQEEASKARIKAAKSEAKAKEAREEANQARKETERILKERTRELDQMQQALSQIAETRRTALGLIMNLDSNAIQFDFDKAVLKPKTRELLSQIAGILLTSKGHRISIYGHTDDVGSIKYNQNLSERRAQSVQNYLINVHIDPKILTSKGFGKSTPLVKGTSKEARAKNRRVEIAIFDTVLDYQQRIQ